ncbi:hypothetical protein JTB14_008318 [Gonioctena quinquepunctata]|nr:hypothetical protein JTB14_008318 [Gonioctena quinquepunctata]
MTLKQIAELGRIWGVDILPASAGLKCHPTRRLYRAEDLIHVTLDMRSGVKCGIDAERGSGRGRDVIEDEILKNDKVYV